MDKPTARERLAEAAFALFDERGYEQTTVDDITERAGLGGPPSSVTTGPRKTSSSPTTTACCGR